MTRDLLSANEERCEFNKLYQQIEARLKDYPDTTKLLVMTQNVWVAYRDALRTDRQ